MLTFTEFLKKRRDVLGLTQEDLAQRLNTTTAYVGLMELDQRRPKKVTSLEKLRIALEIDEQDSGWFYRFVTYDEHPEFCPHYLTSDENYPEPSSGDFVISEDTPMYRALSEIVKHPALDQEQVLRLLRLMQQPQHPLVQMLTLLMQQPDEVIATLLHRLRFELQLLERSSSPE